MALTHRFVRMARLRSEPSASEPLTPIRGFHKTVVDSGWRVHQCCPGGTRKGFIMFTVAFWKAATERAVKTGAQFVAASLGVALGAAIAGGEDGQVINAFALDYFTLFGAFLGGMLVSYLFSIVSAPLGGSGPSLANEVVVGVPKHRASE